MPLDIEDYALIGDTKTAALVGNDGSIDWLCLPHFDSRACFAALLGSEHNGRWSLRPTSPILHVNRRYRPGTLVLETEFETEEGTVRLTECMPPRRGELEGVPDLVRIVEGISGEVPMTMSLIIRFDYGSTVPWVRRTGNALTAVGGPDGLCLRAPVKTRGEGQTTVANFSVAAGERVPFRLTWFPSHEPLPEPVDPFAEVESTEAWWLDWSDQCTYDGLFRDQVLASLVILKALTFAPTGSIVAAPTTSLPEHLGGVRNWDYRFCWLRDASLTLSALIDAGYSEEAKAWRKWLLRAVAGNPNQIRIMYGLSGERWLYEMEIPWLEGYRGSAPVRVGNAASEQFQLDVYGEIMDIAHQELLAGIESEDIAGDIEPLLEAVMDFVRHNWRRPDMGIWEIRGEPRHFTHSKVMAWVAMDRAVKFAESMQLDARARFWRRLRNRIHRDVCQNGFDQEANTFVQYYGSDQVDASLLLIPIVGFLPADDPRVLGTIEAVQKRLCNGALVKRYETESEVDGLPPGDGHFLMCSFWLVDALAVSGQIDQASQNFEQLLAIRNDVGLMAEEYDPATNHHLGNFPQAFSHIGLITSAQYLSRFSDASKDQSAAALESAD